MKSIQINRDDKMASVFPKITYDLFRLGRDSDGGYVLSEGAFKQVDLVLSLGIGDDWSFEEQAAEQLPNVTIVGSDFTVTKELLRNLFLKKFLKLLIGKVSVKELIDQYAFNKRFNSFYGVTAENLGKRISNKDEGIDITLETIIKRYSDFNNILIKMDVEGGEYYTIKSIVKNRQKIPIACIEFHDCATLSHSFYSYLNELREHYDIIHTHINNEGGYLNYVPEVYEITFQRKDLSLTNKNTENALISVLPSSLDKINNPNKIEYTYNLNQ